MSRSKFTTKYLNGRRGNPKYLGQHEIPEGAVIPDSIDWIKLGGVTPVKDQGECGSCWAFSTTGALFAKTKKLVSLSEQEFVDCTRGESLRGYFGGLMDEAFKFAETNRICTEETDPYIANDDACHLNRVCEVGIKKGEYFFFFTVFKKISFYVW